MVAEPSKDVLTSWRNAVAGDLQTSSREIISKGDLESIRAMGKNPDVPEERIPALLAQLGFGVEVEMSYGKKVLLLEISLILLIFTLIAIEIASFIW